MKVHNVEQRSPEWYALRLGIPTASEFGSFFTAKKREPSAQLLTYALTLAAEKFSGQRLDVFEGNQWTERGKELEEKARKLYEFGNEVDIVSTGFITDDAGTMGCSPDGLVNTDGMVEFKCLKAENHIKAILHFREHGTCLPDFFDQTHGQIMIGERAWCDLVHFHPCLPLLVIRQHADAAIQAQLRDAVARVGAERDRVLAILKAHHNGAPVAEAGIGSVRTANLNTAAPVF